MPDYSKACIYKIKHQDDFDDNNIYVGSTCNIIRRKNAHKNNCFNENNKDYNLYVYKYIRDNGGWDCFILVKIHDYACNNKSDLLIEERRAIDMLRPTLNMRQSVRTYKERYEINKEKILKQVNEYREQNKEKISEKRKEKITCECGCIITKRILELHKKTQKHINLMNKKNLANN